MFQLACGILYLYCLYMDAVSHKPWMFVIDFLVFPVGIVRGILYAVGVI